jgi:hypothetical protein
MTDPFAALAEEKPHDAIVAQPPHVRGRRWRAESGHRTRCRIQERQAIDRLQAIQ